MKANTKPPETIDEYISHYPREIQDLLETVRATIRKAAPNATEKIGYAMPTFVLEGNLVHFAAFKNHIGFYPTSSGVLAFQKELTSYVTSKGAIQFPLDKPIPLALISKIVKYRVKENLERAEAKRKNRKRPEG